MGGKLFAILPAVPVLPCPYVQAHNVCNCVSTMESFIDTSSNKEKNVMQRVMRNIVLYFANRLTHTES